MDNLPEQRIGDRERRAVDDRLQRATGEGLLTLAEYDERSGQLWQARTRGDLEAVTVDLPPESSDPPLAAQVAPARQVWGVLSQDRLAGAVQPGQRLQATAVLGAAYVDLRHGELPAHIDLRAVGVLGQVVVLVPPGVMVRLSGASLLGSRKVEVPQHSPGAAVVSVAAYAALGAVVVRSDAPANLDRAAGQVSDYRSTPDRRRGRPHPLRRILVAAALAVGIAAGGVAVIEHGSDGRAVFGSSVVRAGTKDSVDVGVLFGSVKVIVPDDARADTAGTVVFGSLDCNQACDAGRPGRVVHVHGSGGFGSVEVVTQSEYDAG